MFGKNGLNKEKRVALLKEKVFVKNHVFFEKPKQNGISRKGPLLRRTFFEEKSFEEGKDGTFEFFVPFLLFFYNMA